jgi:hypothetical protein
MSTNTAELTKKWIQFLKNNRFVELKPDSSGNLRYKRGVSADDLIGFLGTATDYDDKTIRVAVASVSAKSAGNNSPAKLQNTPNTGSKPAQQPQLPNNQKSLPNYQIPKPKKKYDTSSATDVNYRDVNEEIKDLPGPQFSEDDVEQVFRILASTASSKSTTQPAAPPKVDPSPEKSPDEDLNKIRRMIRDILTPPQRKTLWRSLKDAQSVNEAQISDADVRAIMQTASDMRGKKSIGNVFKSSVSKEDLLNAWVQARRPDDTKDIEDLLKDRFKFSDKEIQKTFSRVFGQSSDGDSYEEPTQSAALTKLMAYIKSSDLSADVVKFIEKEFGEELGIRKQGMMDKFGKMFAKKATTEEVLEVFDVVVKESVLSRQNTDLTTFGRQRK